VSLIKPILNGCPGNSFDDLPSFKKNVELFLKASSLPEISMTFFYKLINLSNPLTANVPLAGRPFQRNNILDKIPVTLPILSGLSLKKAKQQETFGIRKTLLAYTFTYLA
jgi:hypothetical protein